MLILSHFTLSHTLWLTLDSGSSPARIAYLARSLPPLTLSLSLFPFPFCRTCRNTPACCRPPIAGFWKNGCLEAVGRLPPFQSRNKFREVATNSGRGRGRQGAAPPRLSEKQAGLTRQAHVQARPMIARSQITGALVTQRQLRGYIAVHWQAIRLNEYDAPLPV